VSNAVNTVTSSPSVLTVTVPPAPRMYYGEPGPGMFVLTFNPITGLTNSVQTNASLADNGWGVLTNIPPPSTTNTLAITNTISGLQRYYRVVFVP
jgi:hypothetical protein